jgi:hypothetical protein
MIHISSSSILRSVSISPTKKSGQLTLRKLLLVVTAAITMSACFVSAQTRCPADNRADDLATHFVIDGGDIEVPIGAFLLVRKGNEIGAIRLTSIDPTGTEWLGKSVYESYFQGDGSGSFLAGNVVRKTGDLNLQPSKGPGRGIYIYKPGPYRARIGKWSFGFYGPGRMAMTDHSFWTGDLSDHGFEFAPTCACDLSEIDVHDKQLRWFRFDRNANVTLALADLAK